MKRIGTLLVLLAASMFTLGALGCGKTKSPAGGDKTKTKTEEKTKTKTE